MPSFLFVDAIPDANKKTRYDYIMSLKEESSLNKLMTILDDRFPTR